LAAQAPPIRGPERCQLAVDGARGEREGAGQLRGGAPAIAERLEQGGGARGERSGPLGASGAPAVEDAFEQIRADLRAVGEQCGGAQDVLELADVAGPAVACQHLGGVRMQPLLARHAGQHVEREQRQVVETLSQGRQAQREHVEPVPEVLAEAAGAHVGFEVPVGRAHDAHVHGTRPGAAHRRHLAFLEDANATWSGGGMSPPRPGRGCHRRLPRTARRASGLRP
jgi:hypothetical protein